MSIIHEKLVAIQSELKAPKSQTNKFGGYSFRSCEDILEALKPHLKEHDLVLTISDEMVAVGDRIYVKATAKISHQGAETVETSAFAREEVEKKGMSESQITGAASSYARKYALNGLFCIDDTKDSDATNQHEKKQKPLVEAHAGPATPEQLKEIQELCEGLKITPQLAYDSMTAGQAPNYSQAVSMIATLKAKLSKKLDEVSNPAQ